MIKNNGIFLKSHYKRGFCVNFLNRKDKINTDICGSHFYKE